MTDAPIQFLCTSYVHEHPQGPLSVTAIEDGHLRVVCVLYGTENVRQQLASGTSLDDVVASLKAIQHTTTSFPIEQLTRIVWNDFSSEIVFTYESGNKRKRLATCIASEEDRTRLLATIRECVGGSVECSDEPASVLAVAWTRILGAAMAVAGTIVFYVLWDPVRIGRVRGGQIALLLGREGCVVVGVGIFLACCVSAWIAIRKRSRYYTCVVG